MAPSVVSEPAVPAPAQQQQQQQKEEYQVKNETLFDPQNKKLRLRCIGAGVSGIMMAYQIQKNLENYDFKIYERESDIGGTWLLNKYPGCACDIPSHAYTYNFALNPDWPSFFSPSSNIWSYLNRVCCVFALRKYMTFRSEITRAEWHEDSATWKLRVRQTGPDGKVKEVMDECDVLLHATGVLNNFKWPKIKGIERFGGKLIHTARWPADYQAEQWKNERVAVIGSGASSVQTVPNMQPHVASMSVWIRTSVWYVEIAGNNGENTPYTPEQQELFRRNPEKLVEEAKALEDKINSGFAITYKDSVEQKMVKQYFTDRTKGILSKKPELAEKMIPEFSVGCRRITPGDPYLHAIQEDNVEVIFSEVVEITENSLIGKDGTEREVDTIVCATGFDTSFRPAFPIVGRNGVELAEKWKTTPEAYLGLAVPDFPNFFTFIGPTWPIGNGSVMGPLEAVGTYVISFLQKFQGESIRTFEPKQDVTDEFNEHAQEYLTHTVWADACNSWYKDHQTGRINAIWPGSSLHYIETISRPRYEDYSWSYNARNRWGWLGNGKTRDMRKVDKGEEADLSPYMSLGRIDPVWLEAVRKGPNGVKIEGGKDGEVGDGEEGVRVVGVSDVEGAGKVEDLKIEALHVEDVEAPSVVGA